VSGLDVQPTEEEVQFILDAISDYLTVKVRDTIVLLLRDAMLCGSCVLP
jgi:glycerol-3-phosphate dehydrogenase